MKASKRQSELPPHRRGLWQDAVTYPVLGPACWGRVVWAGIEVTSPYLGFSLLGLGLQKQIDAQALYCSLKPSILKKLKFLRSSSGGTEVPRATFQNP